VPISGTTKVQRLQENTGAVDVELAREDLKEIADMADRVDLRGERSPGHMQRWIDR
jgi:aryl-alcohol dehydrogenase-like predicted oxidoreductase